MSDRTPNNENDLDSGDEADIEFGMRCSRRNTNYHHRNSSALYPAQRMEQAVYYDTAEIFSDLSLSFAQIIATLLASYNQHMASLSIATANAIEAIQLKAKRIKEQIDHLLFVLSWLRAYSELSLLYAEDLTIYIRRRNRFYEKRNRRIDALTNQDCDIWFGVSKHNLRRLFVQWRIPNRFTVRTSRHVYGGEESFIIFLYHLTKGSPFTDMARNVFGGDPRSMSPMFEMMIEHLYSQFYNKISGTSLDQWLPLYVHRCRTLIHGALSDTAIFEEEYLNGEVVDQRWIVHHFDLASFRPFAFVDDFAIPTARPATNASRRNQLQHDIQRAFYSGYLRRHGLKVQVVFLLIGVIGSILITEL